jgi:hypothetical protein
VTLNRHRRELPPWSLEYLLIPSPTFPSDDTPLSPSCPTQPQIRLTYQFSNQPTLRQQGNKALISQVKLATRLLLWVYILSIAILKDYNHDRNKDDVERVLMHSRVSSNSYNIDAQVNCKVMIVIRQKPYWGSMH